MLVPIRDEDFPQYFAESGKLLAFISRDKMYKIEPIGSNKNPGVTIDHYITRNMVIKHYPRYSNRDQLTSIEFKRRLDRLFSAYISKIVQ